jgi:hypothetical protein
MEFADRTTAVATQCSRKLATWITNGIGQTTDFYDFAVPVQFAAAYHTDGLSATVESLTPM